MVCPVRTVDILRTGRRKVLQTSDTGLQTRRVLQTQTSVLFGSKKFEFLKIDGVPARTREVEQERTRGEGIGFSRFCADVFYGRAPNANNENVKKQFEYMLKLLLFRVVSYSKLKILSYLFIFYFYCIYFLHSRTGLKREQ